MKVKIWRRKYRLIIFVMYATIITISTYPESKKAQPKEVPGSPSPAFQFSYDQALPSVQLQLKFFHHFKIWNIIIPSTILFVQLQLKLFHHFHHPKNCNNCKCCSWSFLIRGSQWMLGLLFSIVTCQKCVPKVTSL